MELDTESFLNLSEIWENYTDAADTIITDDSEVQIIKYVVGGFVYFVFMIVILIGNLFVIGAYCRDKNVRRNITNVYIVNLAIADFTVGIVTAINFEYYVLGDWSFGKWFCMFTYAIDFASTDMSVVAIIAISVDRFKMVHCIFTHRTKQSRRKIAIFFLCVWILCLTGHLLLAYLYSFSTDFVYLTDGECNLEYRHSKPLLVSLFVIEFVIPAVCITLLNLKVYAHLAHHRGEIETIRSRRASFARMALRARPSERRTSESLLQINSVRRCNGHEIPVNGHLMMRSESPTLPEPRFERNSNQLSMYRGSRNVQMDRHPKAARLLTLVLIAYVITWLPYYIFDCVSIFSTGEPDGYVSKIMIFILWSNSAINPVIYAFNNVYFRRNFQHFLCIKRIR